MNNNWIIIPGPLAIQLTTYNSMELVALYKSLPLIFAYDPAFCQERVCDGAGARYLVRGSLRAWLVYLDVASPPSLAPHLDIFVIQHLFKHTLHLFKLWFRGICSSRAAFIQAVTEFAIIESILTLIGKP